MNAVFISLFNFSNGAFVMTIVFLLVIIGLVGAVLFLMNTDKKKSKK
jgi:hypothetical protein